MGQKYQCLCGGEEFKAYTNVYSEEIVPELHFEVVCKKCRKGIVLFTHNGRVKNG